MKPQPKTIRVRTDAGMFHTTAKVMGQWAAHKSWAKSGWSVTHIPTGLRVPSRILTEREAVDLAIALEDNLYLEPADLDLDLKRPGFNRINLPTEAGELVKALLEKDGLLP